MTSEKNKVDGIDLIAVLALLLVGILLIYMSTQGVDAKLVDGVGWQYVNKSTLKRGFELLMGVGSVGVVVFFIRSKTKD